VAARLYANGATGEAGVRGLSVTLTWDIAGEVVAQLERPGWGASYVAPLPVPHGFIPTAGTQVRK
jgi:hypothetical protein